MSVKSKFRKNKKRHEITGAASIDSNCRHHGFCHWCFMNRNISTLRRLQGAKLEDSGEEFEIFDKDKIMIRFP